MNTRRKKQIVVNYEISAEGRVLRAEQFNQVEKDKKWKT